MNQLKKMHSRVKRKMKNKVTKIYIKRFLMLENSKIKYLMPMFVIILFMTCDESEGTAPVTDPVDYLLSIEMNLAI